MSVSVLGDGTVIPHFLGAYRPEHAQDTNVHTNVELRVGEVKEIIYPKDERNLSGKRIEYIVMVEHSKGSSPMVQAKYGGSVVSSLFGGKADFTHYTLRADPDELPQDALGLGSKVLLACINGHINNTVILGGIPDPKSDSDTQDDGHNWRQRFNGVDWYVNNDGELTLTYMGATDIKGDAAKGVDASKTGAFMKFDKDGNWRIESVPTNIILKSSQGVLTGDATDHTVLGDTYRRAEDTMLDTIKSAFTSMSSAATQASAAIGAAGSQLVLGNAAGGGVALSNAVAALATISAQLQAAATAIATFKAQANKYLSTKNKSD